MTVPSRAALFFALLLAVLLIGIVVEPALLGPVLAFDLVLLALCLLEGRRLRQIKVDILREGNRSFQVGRPVEIVFLIRNRSNRPFLVGIRQRWPVEVLGPAGYSVVEVEAGEEITLSLSATAGKRGHFLLPPAEIDLQFPHGLSIRRWDLPENPAFTVYPDLQALYDFETLRRNRSLQRLGLHRQRRIGMGREFEQLRDYNPDDDYRDINWKATARRLSPITNVYQEERCQDLLLCLDCGRMMGNPSGRGTVLDAAIDAGIMLAHAANRQSDQVGLALFADTVDLLLKPRSGTTAVHRLIEELVKAEAGSLFPSYANLVARLRASHKRRSMIFLFTDLNDPQLARDLTAVMPLICRRHLVTVISLKDPYLERVAEGGAEDRSAITRVMAARELTRERESRMADLKKHGVQVLEADVGSITMEVLNRYLEIKSRQML